MRETKQISFYLIFAKTNSVIYEIAQAVSIATVNVYWYRD